MRINVLSFSKRGGMLNNRILNCLSDEGYTVRGYATDKFAKEASLTPIGKLEATVARLFYDCEALVFIGESSTAVRAIAPFVRSKITDPTVILIDEQAKFAIPLLSGHGGANDLTYELSDKIGTHSIITTAKDVAGVFAVDSFAKKNHLNIREMVLAKEISSAILSGDSVGFECDYQVGGNLPDSFSSDEKELGIFITTDLLNNPFKNTLHLVPKNIVLGISCKKGTTAVDIERFIMDILRQYQIPIERVDRICTLDSGQDEKGILEVTDTLSVDYRSYNVETLKKIKGKFTTSASIDEGIDIDNISERSAVCGSHGGKLIIKKVSNEEITLSAAVQKLTIHF